jgi:hypothetical protein
MTTRLGIKRFENGKAKEVQKTLKGPNATLIGIRANQWKDAQEDVGASRELPVGITAVERSSRMMLRARLPMWADPKQQARYFPADALDAAVAWLKLATEALSAEPPLPLPEPEGRLGRLEAARIVTIAPTLFRDGLRRWHAAYYDARVKARKCNPDRPRRVQG